MEKKLDKKLLDASLRCVEILERLHNEGYGAYSPEQFKELKHRNLGLYVALNAHAMFEDGLKGVVVLVTDIDPNRKSEVENILRKICFTQKYAAEINQKKRSVMVKVMWKDNSPPLDAYYGVKLKP